MNTDFKYLPEKYHKQHKICWYLVSEIEEFFTNDEYSGLRVQTIKLLKNDILKDEHVLDFLLRKGMTDEHDQIVKNNLINSILIDMCYFLQEALECSLKRRLTITFALLRKPFVYSFIVVLRIIFEEDFIAKFNYEKLFDPANVKDDYKKELIGQSLNLLFSKSYTADDIYDWIFNKQTDSISNMSDKALHLSTTRNKQNLTGDQNFNYIFSTHENIDSQWDLFYRRLQALLFYLIQVIDALVATSINVDDNFFHDRINRRMAKLNDI